MAKKMTASEQAEYDRESAAIRDNMKKPEAKQRHKFKPAKFTFGNGHPRCLVCGDEEAVGGYCNSSDVNKADEDIAFVATLTKETVDEMDDAALKDSAERLADVWDRKFVGSDEDPDGLNREEVLLAALGVLGTAVKREIILRDRYLYDAATAWATNWEQHDDNGVEKTADSYRPIKGFFTAYGTLFRFRNKILPHAPDSTSFDKYVELTTGPGSLFWWRAPTCKEVINDIDENICRLYRICKELTDTQLNKLESFDWTFSVKRFKELAKEDPKSGSDLQFLFRELYIRKGSRTGRERSDCNPHLEGRMFSPFSDLRRARDRLKNISISNADFAEVVKRHDSSNTLFFLDPPYPDRTERLYAEGTEDLIDRIASVVGQVKGKFMLVTTGKKTQLSSLFAIKGIHVSTFRWTQPMANVNPHARKHKPAYIFMNYRSSSVVKKYDATEAVTVSGSWLRFKMRPCEADYIDKTCHGNCCRPTGGPTVVVLEKERAVIEKHGGKINGSILATDGGRCQFQKDDNLCELHNKNAKPLSCQLSPFMLNNNDTLVFSYRYAMMKCHKEGTEPAYKAHRASLVAVFGEKQTDRICSEAKAGKDFIEARVSSVIYESLKKISSERSRQTKSDLAPVHPGSEGEHEPLVLGDVLASVKPSMLIRDAVSYVGSLPQWNETRGDVDVLNKIPDGDALRHIVNFRVGRQYEPEISGRLKFMDEDEYLANRESADHGRLSFHDDELGGPFTTHVPGYDLWLVPKTYDVVPREGAEFTRVEMAADIAKQAGEYRKYPPTKNKPVRSAVQAHFRGRSVGYDWRIASLAGKDVIGWSIDAQKPKVIKEPVQTLQEAKRYTAGVGLEGNRYFKPLTGPGGIGVRAHQKPLEPREWMEIDTRVVDPGGIGATKEHHGVFVAIDRPMVELGIQEPYFHEYFATRGSWFNGTAFLRQLVGRGGEAAEEEAGRVTRRGEAYWKFSFAVKPLPSVLRRRAVREGKMPPPGIAAIPRDLMALVPAEYRYWEKRGAAAKQARDALVSSKFFTEDNVRVVGGKYVRVSEKQVFYSVPSQTEKAGAVDGKYRFVWQYWKRRAETVREAPTREMWHLLVQASGKKYGWTFFQDPLTSKRASGTSGSPSAADWKREGEIEPGTTGGLINNERKATPSWAVVREAGKAQVLTEAGPEKNSLLVRLETKDQPVMLYLRPEEKGARTWISEIRSAKAVEFDALPDSALVSFAKHGPEIAECPGCGELEFDRIDEVGKCLKCGVSAFVDPIARHAWELQMSGADLGAVPVVVAEAVPAPENTTEEPSPPVDGDGNGTLPIVRVPIGKGDEFKGYFFDIVIKPNDGRDGPAEPDTQKDVYNSAEIDYAMRWNAEHAETDKINHDPSIPATGDHAFVIVQNFLAPVDYWLGPHGETKAEPNDWRDSVLEPPGDGYRFVPKGSWLREGKATGKKLYDALLKGEITAWSIEGSAVKTPEYIEIKAAIAAA